VTINGNGSTIRRGDQAPEFRIMAVGRRGDLRLNNTTIRDGLAEARCVDGVAFGGGGIFAEGKLTLNNATVTNNRIYSYDKYDACDYIPGGGIFNIGQLIISNSTISSNKIQSDDYYEPIAHGGGIYNKGQMTITHSNINNNIALLDEGSSSGGGIYNEGKVTVTNTVISGNESIGYYYTNAGGIYNSSSGEVTIEGSVISGNVASPNHYGYDGSGGGIFNYGKMTINQTTISNNDVYGDFSDGGGISNLGNLFIRNSNISNNSSDYGSRGYGGGIASWSGEINIVGTTISGNKTNGYMGSWGGGIFIGQNGFVAINNSSIGNNEAFSEEESYSFGGGIANQGRLEIIASSISRNTAENGGGIAGLTDDGWSNPLCSNTVIEQSIVTGNFGINGREVILKQVESGCTSTIDLNAYNVFGFSSNAGLLGLSPGQTDIVPSGGVRTVLLPLADNGGPTLHSRPAARQPGDRLCAQYALPERAGRRRRPARLSPQRERRRQPSNRECDAGSFEYLSAPAADGD
jgi:hypothetical protein